MSAPKFNEDQEIAIEGILDWIKRTEGKTGIGNDLGPDWMFCLAGYAGTGKTYLLGHLASMISGTVHFLAPTGKAASVLASKLNGIEVSTIHSMLYLPVDEDVQKLTHLMNKLLLHPDDKELKEQVNEEVLRLNSRGPGFANRDEPKISRSDIVVVDESSMVDERLRDDLKATGCRVLFVGDSGQLPPVGDGGWFLKIKPNAILEKIQRQALDNPIIRFSMEVRNGTAKPRDWRKKEGCGIWKAGEVDLDKWTAVDQIITGRNASRHKINRFIRKKLGFAGQQPQEGEKLICLKNDNRRIPQFINGTIFRAMGNSEIELGAGVAGSDIGSVNICYDGVNLAGVSYYPFHCQANYEKDIAELPRNFRKGLMELDFAYAITCHKSQGSEWSSVIVADDQMQKADANFRRRWLYTAVTRAKHELLLIQTD